MKNNTKKTYVFFALWIVSPSEKALLALPVMALLLMTVCSSSVQLCSLWEHKLALSTADDEDIDHAV